MQQVYFSSFLWKVLCFYLNTKLFLILDFQWCCEQMSGSIGMVILLVLVRPTLTADSILYKTAPTWEHVSPSLKKNKAEVYWFFQYFLGHWKLCQIIENFQLPKTSEITSITDENIPKLSSYSYREVMMQSQTSQIGNNFIVVNTWILAVCEQCFPPNHNCCREQCFDHVTFRPEEWSMAPIKWFLQSFYMGVLGKPVSSISW